MNSTVCGTVSGRRVDLARPDWREISLDDLARGLSQVNRFAGQSRRTISDAEHSLVVMRIAPPRLALAAVLHDGHEGILGDWTIPAVEALALEVGPKLRWAISIVKMRLDIAIARRVVEDIGLDIEEGLDWAAQEIANEMRDPAVKFADAEAFRLEDAIRAEGALQHGPSPAISAAAEYYGVLAPSIADVASEWKSAVLAAAQVWGLERCAK